MVFGLGRILYCSLLLINSLAILNEDRFLSRGASSMIRVPNAVGERGTDSTTSVGWSSSAAHQQSQLQFQDPSFGEGPGVKARMINLIGAVRTLMRSALPILPHAHCLIMLTMSRNLTVPLIGINTLIIIYEIAWG